MSETYLSETIGHNSTIDRKQLPESSYVATAAEALKNWHENPTARWYKKGVAPDEPGGTFAFQRLREPLFTPTIKPGFKLQRGHKFFAIGSCFARGIEQALVNRKMDVLSAAPEFAALQTVSTNVTALGFTNKYNTFSIDNELQWALNPEAECPHESIVDLGGNVFCDPHITPMLPLADEKETWRRRSLINMVNQRVVQCRVVIITLGLIEAWRDTITDTFINTTPISEVFRRYPDRYEFHVTDFSQNLTNLEKIHALLERFGHPDIQIVVTVSPVPLMATFSGQDVVVANTYAKSLLRAVAQEWAAKHNNVHYFPSYEICQNSERAVVWEEDLRHVKNTTTDHIMNLFLDSYLG
jgi:hypothetical protein